MDIFKVYPVALNLIQYVVKKVWLSGLEENIFCKAYILELKKSLEKFLR